MIVSMRGNLKRYGWHCCTLPMTSMSLRVEKDKVWLASLRVEPSKRSAGIGTRALREVTSFAHMLRLPVVLYPMADFPVYQRRLVKWYLRNGFKFKKDGTMIYE